MPYLVVMVVSLGVGAVVYVLSMRAEEPEPVAIGFEPTIVPPPQPVEGPAEGPAVEESVAEEPARVGGPDPGYTYLKVAVTKGPSLQERIQGLVGSIALVAAAAVAVAGGFYAIGALLSRLIRSFLGENGS